MRHRYLSVLKAGILVGSFDILAAFLLVLIKTGKLQVFNILKFIASGIFGKDASAGGLKIVIAGLILHYTIAFLFTLLFFWLYPKMNLGSKNKWITGIVYGVLIWFVMNRVVLPLSNVIHRPFSLSNALINVGILIICIGIPLSLRARRFYRTPMG
jgi:hypothetical protein